MGSALIISLRKRRIRCPTRSKHRLYVPFVRQKRGGLPKGPLHVRRGALRRAVPAALSGPGGLHCRRQCPGEGSYTTAPLCHWAVPAAMSGPGGLHCRRQCPGERPYTSAPLCHWAVPAPLSGPGGLHCRGQCLGERPYISAPLSFGQCPPPCPAREVCIAGDSAPGRGHTHQRPLALGCARCLVRPKRSALPETVPRGEAIHISAP